MAWDYAEVIVERCCDDVHPDSFIEVHWYALLWDQKHQNEPSAKLMIQGEVGWSIIHAALNHVLGEMEKYRTSLENNRPHG